MFVSFKLLFHLTRVKEKKKGTVYNLDHSTRLKEKMKQRKGKQRGREEKEREKTRTSCCYRKVRDYCCCCEADATACCVVVYSWLVGAQLHVVNSRYYDVRTLDLKKGDWLELGFKETLNKGVREKIYLFPQFQW